MATISCEKLRCCVVGLVSVEIVHVKWIWMDYMTCFLFCSWAKSRRVFFKSIVSKVIRSVRVQLNQLLHVSCPFLYGLSFFHPLSLLLCVLGQFFSYNFMTLAFLYNFFLLSFVCGYDFLSLVPFSLSLYVWVPFSFLLSSVDAFFFQTFRHKSPVNVLCIKNVFISVCTPIFSLSLSLTHPLLHHPSKFPYFRDND